MANDLEPASAASLVSLLGDLINEAKELCVHEWTLLQREARRTVRNTQRAALALGGGAGVTVTGGLLLLVMLVSLLAAWTEIALWGCYGLIGGAFALIGGVLLARGKIHGAALNNVPPLTVETPKGKVHGRAEQPTVELQPGLRPSASPGRAGQPSGSPTSLNGKAFWELCKATFTQWSEEKPFQLAATLAYYTLFSLAPLLIIAIAIAGLVFGHGGAQNHIVSTLQGVMGSEGAHAIQARIQQASRPSSGILAVLMGIVTLLVGAGGVIGQLQASLNTILDVEPKPGRGLLGLLRDRFVSFGMVLSIGFLLLVSLVVSAGLAAVSQFMGGVLPGGAVVWHGVDVLISFGFIMVLFALIYKVLPDVHLAWRDVWIGAAMDVPALYAGQVAAGSVPGAQRGNFSLRGRGLVGRGAAVGVLFGADCFFGAEFTQVYANVYGAGMEPADNAQPLSAGARPQPGGVYPGGGKVMPAAQDNGLRHGHE
jgi:membrane protein